MKKIAFLMLGAATTLTYHGQAQAQSTSASTSDQMSAQQYNGDIVVTATRNSSLASKTPVSLTAVTGAALISQGVASPSNLGEQVPNLAIDRNNGLQITIRGISSSDNTEKGDPSAAFMLDGIYIARAQAQEVSFFDINRVEVLRGPQGTLFGRNTTAGLVHVITNEPQLGKFSGGVDAAYGNYDSRQITGVVNIPVGSSIAVRAAANYDRRDSYYNANPNWLSPLDPGKRNISGRLSTLIDLGKARLVIRGDYSSIRGTDNAAYFNLPLDNFYANYSTPGVDPIYIGNSMSAHDLRTVPGAYSEKLGARNNTWGIGADFSYDFGLFTLNYLGSYREFDRHEQAPFTLGAGALQYPTHFDGNYKQNSQEIRLSTNGDGPIKAQVGAYYFRDTSNIFLYITGLANPTPGQSGYIYGFPQSPTKSESIAGFAQVTARLAEGLRLTGGLRYSHDEKSRDGRIIICGTLACDLPTDTSTVNSAAASFHKTTWKVGLDYDVSSTAMFYANVATGYKAGGFNDGCEIGTGAGCSMLPEALYYQPETLTAYEAGLKARFLDNAVRINLAAFHYDYDNIQLTQVKTIGGLPLTITANAAKAKVDGVEVEGLVQPSRNDRFDFSVSWLNGRYTQFVPAPGYDWSGKKLDRSPEFTFTAGYTHTFELGEHGNIEAGVRTRVSDHYQIAALGTFNQFRVPGYSRTNAQLTYNAPDNRWYLQGYVKNIENAIVISYAATTSFPSVQLSEPRTYGVRAGYKF